LPNLKVMSRNSVFHYKGKDMDAQAVAKELNVQAVPTGRVTQRGEGLSINVELINAQDNSQIWGQQYTVQFDITSNIWIAPLNDLMHGKQITFGKLDADRGIAWTPDGKIVYTSMAGGNLDLWIMNGDGTNQKQLTSDSYFESGPVVSPDGKYIVFNSTRGALPSVWRMDLDGSNVKQLTDHEDYLMAITNDGQSIIFNSWRTTKLSLWRASIDGSNPVQISNLFVTGASISPDGKLLACRYREENPNLPPKLVILPIDGGTPTKTFELLPTTVGSPGWTPDGKSLIVADTRTGTTNLWSFPPGWRSHEAVDRLQA
jgi:Tol biopolymer transport system component